jgi:hypothetical protein
VGGLGVLDVQARIQLQATERFQKWSLEIGKYWYCQDQKDRAHGALLSETPTTPYMHSKRALNQASSVLELGQRS